MRLSDFHYDLPPELIARYPLPERSASRLLCLENNNALTHRQFTDLPNLLSPGDLLVFNDTRVIPARLYGYKSTGGHIEILIERLLDKHRALAHIRASKSPKPGAVLFVSEGIKITVTGRQDDLFEIVFDDPRSVLEILNTIGHIPLPPYMSREDELLDKSRYQTIFARNEGAVAAPTASLHFDEDLFIQLKNRQIETAFVTLHVGSGTFQPVRTEHIEDHKMHAEYMEISEAVCEQIRAAKARGNRIIAVGTTSLRCLETAKGKPYSGYTDIFIYPGYQFQCVDALLTNFHLPESTLLMLVCAFAGYEPMMRAYQVAIQHSYRFFSYGDAMWLTKS